MKPINTYSPRPLQASSGGIMISYFTDTDKFRLTLRETTLSSGLVLTSKSISIVPTVIANGENPLAFADLLESMVARIRSLVSIQNERSDK